MRGYICDRVVVDNSAVGLQYDPARTAVAETAACDSYLQHSMQFK